MASFNAPSFALRRYLHQCLSSNISQPRCAIHRTSIRQFSPTCRRTRGLLINYPPTSSAELDSLLHQARETIFLPRHLEPTQRDLFCRPSLQHVLRDEPMVVTVQTSEALDTSKTGTETVSLRPADKKPEIRQTALLAQLIPLLRAEGDFLLLPSFLRELLTAKRKLRQSHVSKIIRQAARRGVYGPMLELIKKGEDIGLLVDSAETAKEVMLLCLRRAYAGGEATASSSPTGESDTADSSEGGSRVAWQERDVEKALKHAQGALRMMQSPTHMSSARGPKASFALQADVAGVALALASIRAVKFKNGKDEDGKVREFAQVVADGWAGSRERLEVFLSDKLAKEASAASVTRANLVLQDWLPAWMGVQLAQRVLGDGVGDERIVKLWAASEDVLTPAMTGALAILEAAPKSDAVEETESNWRGVELYRVLSPVLE